MDDIKDAPQVENKRAGDWMQVFTGIQYWPMDPRADEVSLLDIAHSLSMQCRYNGHVNHFYSVAQHCFHVSHLVSRENAVWGLLHDAAEAYCTDIPRPMKKYLAGYEGIEAANMAVICDHFGLSYEAPDEVKLMDAGICLAEAAALMKEKPAEWNIPEALRPDIDIVPWSPELAKARFLKRAHDLGLVVDWEEAA